MFHFFGGKNNHLFEWFTFLENKFVKKILSNYDLKQILFCFENTGVYSLPLSYYFSNNELSYRQKVEKSAQFVCHSGCPVEKILVFIIEYGTICNFSFI